MFVPSVVDESGGLVDRRDWPRPRPSGYARSVLPGFAAVLSARPLALSGGDQLELVKELTSCVAVLDWHRYQAVVAFALCDNRGPLARMYAGRRGGPAWVMFGGEGTPPCSEFLPAELAGVLACSQAEAARWVAVSLDVRFRLRTTSHHLGGGRLTWAHARVISEATRRLGEADAARVEDRLAQDALTRTPARLRVLARCRVARTDPAGMRARARQAYLDRSVSMFALDDGIGAFSMNHQLDMLAVIDDQLDSWARQRLGQDPGQSFAAHKADAAACLLLAKHPLTGQPLIGAGADAGPVAGPDPRQFLPARTELRVTMTADALLDLDDDGCQLEGLGPITADQARRLALQSAPTVLRRVFTDPADNSIMFLDAASYRFRTDQAEAIRTLHPISVFPGSTVPARNCDLDHRIPYTQGDPDSPDPPGQTVVANAQPLHRKGHRLRTHGNWQVEQTPHDPHELTWTSPYRRTYTVHDHDGA